MGSYDYSGCLSVPRVLSVKGDKLMQEPADQISELRHGASWHDSGVTLYPEEPTPLPGISGEALDLDITVERGSSEAAGVCNVYIRHKWCKNQAHPHHWCHLRVEVAPG